MRISVTIFVILISTYIVNASVLDPVIENVVHLKASKPPSGVPGIWKKKTIWKPRWVKEWKSAKVMKPVWRKVWSPVQIREWVPIPKPPPGWEPVSTPLALVDPPQKKANIKGIQKTPLTDSLGHDSFAVHSSAQVPLWDPVPYPESQQPPPAPFLQHLSNADLACKNGCDNSPSQTFSHSQISEIIGSRYQMSEYYQNPEYSETVNHLTRLPPDGNNWKPPQPHQNFQLENRFNNFQGPPEFLVPPKFQSLPENNFPLQPANKNHLPNGVTPLSSLPQLDIKNSFRQWIPLPSDNKIQGHFITKPPNQPPKSPTSGVVLNIKNATNTLHKEFLQNLSGDSREKTNIQTQQTTSGIRSHAGGDFIQEAQLVGEYHYSEIDLPNVKSELDVPQPNLKEKDEISAKAQAKIPQQGSLQTATTNEQAVDKQRQTLTGTDHAARQTATKYAENKQKPNETRIRQPEVHNTQDGPRVHKKHIANFSRNLSNSDYQQQEPTIKEIFPDYKASQNTKSPPLTNQESAIPTIKKNQEKALLFNGSSSKTALAANTTVTNFNIQKQKEIYPVFEIPENVNPVFIPPNHRFHQPSQVNFREKPFSSNNSTRLQPVPSVNSEEAFLEKNNAVQLVFATTPDDYKYSTEDLQKTTTTEPYEIIFSSSSTTAESVSKSPIIIVTPANSNKS